MLTRFKESPEPHGLPDCFDNKIMHATVRIGKTTLMASDGQCEGNQDFEGFALSITLPNETEAERVFAALGQGGSGYHAAGEDVLDGKIRNATGPVWRHLDGFDRAQARSWRRAFPHGVTSFAKCSFAPEARATNAEQPRLFFTSNRRPADTKCPRVAGGVVRPRPPPHRQCGQSAAAELRCSYVSINDGEYAESASIVDLEWQYFGRAGDVAPT